MTTLFYPTPDMTVAPTNVPHQTLASYRWVTVDDIKLLRKWLRNAQRTEDTLLRDDIYGRIRLAINCLKWRKDDCIWVMAKKNTPLFSNACFGALVVGYTENFVTGTPRHQVCYTNENLTALVDEMDQAVNSLENQKVCVNTY